MDANLLTELAARLWQPWVAALLLLAAAVLTLATGFVQLRGLPAAVRQALAARRGGEEARFAMLAVIAASCGIGGLGAGVLAVQWGGRGALMWMWITMVLAMALRFADAALRRPSPTAVTPASPKAGGGAMGLVMLLAGLAVAGSLQGQQLGTMVETLWDGAPLTGAIALAVLAVPLLWLDAGRRVLLQAAPWALLGWLVIAGVLLARDDLMLSLALGDAWGEAFGLQPAVTGALTGGAAHAFAEGVLAAALAGAVGPSSTSPRARTHVALLAPLVGIGLIGSLGGLVAATAPSRDSIVLPEPTPLERYHSRGLRPSQQVGQTVVMPVDSPLEADKFYAFLLRSNPRGIAFAQLDGKNNAVLVPGWQVADGVHDVIFRMREKDPAAKNMSWDVRVPCNREEVTTRDGSHLVKLTPVNPDLELRKLIAYYELSDKPYVPLADAHFVGKLGIAQSPDENLGEHLAMFEAEGADRPFNPKLHEFFRGGYRGPYADIEQERPPMGWIAVAGFEAELGTKVALRLPASSRGEPFVRVNRAGGIEAPAWDLLMRADELVVRHQSDPTQDIVIPVRARLDGYRIRYETDDPEWQDFRALASRQGFLPTPFVRVRDVDFDAEVHGDARLAPEFRGHRSLVALHELVEPQGPWGEVLPYHPHPMELVGSGMHGPVLARDGAAVIAGRLRDESGDQPRWLGHLAGVLAFVLALGCAAGWTHLLAPGVSSKITVIVLASAMAGGGAMAWPVAQAFAAVAFAVVVIAVAIAGLRGLATVRAAANDPE
ncbi:MAG: sodium:alanine symporter family protein [Deltaproteobacteria bacterium]|nr:sodium:alanine symporter family protein [Deltaproteobacteria bacterium]MBK8718100.1 sodium:alanine symporter family protein [Deltaproteobacteria bacterium]MBP7288490.1 sodium:alanine symporter family protein [Nannocystaceae bacterium]